jgi:hypothetical protein
MVRAKSRRVSNQRDRLGNGVGGNNQVNCKIVGTRLVLLVRSCFATDSFSFKAREKAVTSAPGSSASK